MLTAHLQTTDMQHYTIMIVMPKAETKLEQFYNLELPDLGGWID